jgi:hypothetical protein
MSIFYRRDLVTDQKLEKRLETEADLFQGKILLNQLPNTVATKEYVDEAVAGSGSGTSLIPLFVVVNTDGNIAYSNDGESWTDEQRLTYDGNNLNVERVSIAKDYIIYLGGIFENNERLYYASSYDIPETQLISFPSTYLETTGTFSWEDIKFGGQYTVAVGRFTPDGSESQSVPVFAYTSNGLSWSLGDVDPSYYGFASNASFKSVDYNGVGWLFVSSSFSPNGEIIEGAQGTGAFFITNIMEQLSEDNFIYTPVESENSEEVDWNTDSVVWTGDRWWLRDSSSDETNSLGYLVSSGANPLTSTWTLVNPLPAVLAAGLGESEEFYEDAGGTIYGTHWFVAANGQGQVVASSDGGQTWVTSVPNPYIGIVLSIDNNVESTISFGESDSPSMSQKIVISNAVPSSFNGTFYVNTDSSKLYTDVTLETPFDTSEMDEFVSATATLSKGQFIDGIGFGLGKFIAANDDKEIFKSTNLQTWTQVYNSIEGGDFNYWNDIDFNAEWEISSAGPSLGDFTISGSTMSSNERITITNETNDSADLYIKAGDDLYLEAHDDDLFIRSADDVRIQTDYNFNDGVSGYEWEFTNNGDLIFPDGTTQTTAYQGRINSISLDNNDIVLETQDGEITKRWEFASDGATYLSKNSFEPTTYLSTPINDTTASLEITAGRDIYLRTAGYDSEGGTSTSIAFKFDDEGAITFPDNTVQTTAFDSSALEDRARIVDVPSTNLGAPGDKAGDIAFDDNNLYTCIQDFPVMYTATLVGGYSNGAYPTLFQGEYPKPLAGWQFTFNNVTYTLTEDAVQSNPGEWSLSLNATINTGISGTNTEIQIGFPSDESIWQSTPWNAGTDISDLTDNNNLLAEAGTGTWTLATGSNTVSFTVDWNNTYVMWVRGNVPNGIIAWNATVSVTNANVPVIGTQYGWNYNSETTEAPVYVLALTSIPTQIIGTPGTISTALPSVGNTANTFAFTINNASGSTQTIQYGWRKV